MHLFEMGPHLNLNQLSGIALEFITALLPKS